MSKTTRVEAINKSWFDSVLLSKTTRIDAYNKSWFVSVLMSKKTRVLPWGMLRVTGQFILFNKFQGQMKCKICNKLFFQSQI